jgi:hypothetical protein
MKLVPGRITAGGKLATKRSESLITAAVKAQKVITQPPFPVLII